MAIYVKRRQSSDFRSIHQYLVGEPIAKGSFAQIRRSLLKENYRECVVKLISKSKMLRHSCDGIDIFTSELFIGPLFRHPFIATVRDAIETRATVIQGLDYYPNGDLLTYLEEHPTVTIERRLEFASEVLAALEYLHSYGICHRDVKPENVLVDDQGHARLCDFGFVAFGPECCGQCGSIGYTAPEVLKESVYDGCRADIYSFGVLVFCILVDNADPTNIDLEKVPKAVADMVRDCLREPAERPKAEDLRKYSCFVDIECEEALPCNHRDLSEPVEVPMQSSLQRLGEIYQARAEDVAKMLFEEDANEAKSLYFLMCDAPMVEATPSAPVAFSRSLPVSTSLDSGLREAWNQVLSEKFKTAAFKVMEVARDVLFSQNFCISTKPDGGKLVILNTSGGDLRFQMYAEDTDEDGCWICFQYNSGSEPHVNALVSHLKTTFPQNSL